MVQAEQHHSTHAGDFYLVDERQFCRLAQLRQAINGIAMIAEGRNLAEGATEMDVQRADLAALFTVLGDHLETITRNLPLRG